MDEASKELLRVAYGEEWGKTGHDLAGHQAVGELDVASVVAQGRGSSLLYGELLPEGVEQLVSAFCAREEPLSGPILELGMGTGKVALQIFLMLHLNVLGVELAPSRYALAAAAIRKLAKCSQRFTFQELGDAASMILDAEHGAQCEFRCASLLDTPSEMLEKASGVVMEVCLPLEVQREASKRLRSCPRGCRIVSYSALHGLVEDCRLAPVPSSAADGMSCVGDGCGGICLAASWKPTGHGFAFYEMAATTEDAAAAWDNAGKSGNEAAVQIDATGCPSRARRLRYTDDVLSDPVLDKYPWAAGDRILVGYSWLPFPDLGDPDDGSAGGLDGVTWMPAFVVTVFEDNFVNVCYQDDGTVEERVHPDRIRIPGKRRLLPKEQIVEAET